MSTEERIPEKVSIREVPRNTKAASVPYLPVAVRPYTLNGREERGPDLFEQVAWGL